MTVVLIIARHRNVCYIMVILTALALPLGRYMAAVYTGERTFLDPLFLTPERLLYRVIRVDPTRDRTGRPMPRA